MTITRARTAQNLRWGIMGGLSIAAVYCVWVTALFLMQGSGPFDRQGVTLRSVILTYLGVGVTAGGAVGLLRPMTSHRFGAYLAGIIAGIPVAVGLAICVRGFPSQWDVADRILVPVFSVIAGVGIGSELRKKSPVKND